MGKQDLIATIHGSFLCASLEIGMLRRALMYVCELRQAKPRALGHPNSSQADPSMQAFKTQPTRDAAGSFLGATDVAQAATARLSWAPTSGSSAAGRVSGDAAPIAMQGKVLKGNTVKSRRNLTVQVFLHCARIDVSSSPHLQYGVWCIVYATSDLIAVVFSLR